MDFLSFSHGQIQSKLWLCENLEPFLPNNAIIANLGSWYNVLGFMMLTRNQDKIQSILGIDIDPSATLIADKMNQAWMIGYGCKLRNVTSDATTYNYQGFNVVINCSTEHMEDGWFDRVTPGTLVCIQTSDVDLDDDVWKVSNPNQTFNEFKKKYPLSHYMFTDIKDITYRDWGYKRFMLIGVK